MPTLTTTSVPRWALVTGAVVATAGIGYLGYRAVSRRRAGKKVKVDTRVIIEKSQLAWLEEMTKKYSLESPSKTLRVILEFGLTDAKEEVVFEKIRCNSCGGHKDKLPFDATIDLAHKTWLEAMATKHKITDGMNKALRVLIEYAKSSDADEAEIFTKIRCRKECANSS